jgi:hypothetical protein
MQKRSSQNKDHFGVGGKLLRHLQAWREIRGEYHIRRRLYTDWVEALPHIRAKQRFEESTRV